MKILAIESSCDEAAAAVVQEGVILSNVVATQMKVHAEYGGVVPELAAREHLSNVLPVVNQALSDAGMSAKDLDWIAATQGPGLPPALMVGYQAAQHMAFALGIPLLGVQHHEAHLYSPWIHPEEARLETEAFEPHISLVVSGGERATASSGDVFSYAFSISCDPAGQPFSFEYTNHEGPQETRDARGTPGGGRARGTHRGGNCGHLVGF